MTRYEVAILVCRSLGIYCFIAALNSLQSLVFGVNRVLGLLADSSRASFNTDKSVWSLVASSAPSALQILFGIALWMGAPIWARLMVRAPQANFDDPIVILPSTPASLMNTLKNSALWFLGGLALLQGVPQVVMASVTWMESGNLAAAGGRAVNLSFFYLPQIALGLTQIFLGVVLLLLARSSSRRVAASIPPVPQPAPETSLPS